MKCLIVYEDKEGEVANLNLKEKTLEEILSACYALEDDGCKVKQLGIDVHNIDEDDKKEREFGFLAVSNETVNNVRMGKRYELGSEDCEIDAVFSENFEPLRKDWSDFKRCNNSELTQEGILEKYTFYKAYAMNHIKMYEQGVQTKITVCICSKISDEDVKDLFELYNIPCKANINKAVSNTVKKINGTYKKPGILDRLLGR